MLKTGILHPQLARVLAELRHKDTLVIGDAGLPIPKAGGTHRSWLETEILPIWMYWRNLKIYCG